MKSSIFLFIFLLIQIIPPLNATNKLVVFTPPKCGTHLIGKALKHLLNKEPHYKLADLGSTQDIVELTESTTKSNGFVVAHNWSKQALNELIKKNYKIIFILRDPRDQVISMQDWMREGQWPWIRSAKINDINKQLMELITGSKYGWKCYDNCIEKRLSILSKLPKESFYITKYEKLVGEKGGGSKDEQILELIQLGDFLKSAMTYEDAEFTAEQIYGGTKTFRVGQIGRWKDSFTHKHKKAYKKRYKKKLIALGYETNYNW